MYYENQEQNMIQEAIQRSLNDMIDNNNIVLTDSEEELYESDIDHLI